MKGNIHERINAEIKRLQSLLKNIPKDRLNATDGLLKRVAFMQITLEDLEDYINAHGATELFIQNKNNEYQRERPEVKIYNTMIKNYVVACKQLLELIPKDNKVIEGNKFMEFMNKNK